MMLYSKKTEHGDQYKNSILANNISGYKKRAKNCLRQLTYRHNMTRVFNVQLQDKIDRCMINVQINPTSFH